MEPLSCQNEPVANLDAVSAARDSSFQVKKEPTLALSEATSSAEPGIHGFVEKLDSDGISGWAYKFGNPESGVKLEIFVNGISAAVVVPSLLREFPVEKQQPLLVRAGFFIPWHDLSVPLNAKTWNIRVQVKNSNLILPMARQSINAEEIMPSKETKNNTSAIKGNFEAANSSSLIVSGWAYDANSTVPAYLEVFVNGILRAEGEASFVRPDLLELCGTHASGFKFTLNPEDFTQVLNTITVRANGQELQGGTKTLSFSHTLTLDTPYIKEGVLVCGLNGWKGGPLSAYVMVDGRAHGLTTFKQEVNGTVCRYPISGIKEDGSAHVYQIIIPGVIADPVSLRWPHYELTFDTVTLDRITGWAFARDRGPLSLELHSLTAKEGQAPFRCEANLRRDDVKAAHDLRSSNCGFDFLLDSTQDGQARVELRDAETQAVLALIDVVNDYDASVNAARCSAQTSSSPSYRKTVLADQTTQLRGETRFSIQQFPQKARPSAVRGVTVVIPVYGGAVETAECLESVFNSKNKTPYDLFIINDCSPEPLIHKYLAHVAKRKLPHVRMVNRRTNKGFSEAVNLGFTASGDDDVILLNADTVVCDGWVDKIIAAARNNAQVGTLTPLSNNGELATVPYICKTLPINSPAIAQQIDRTAQACNAGKVVDMPVGIGFCMYINRDCLNEVGLFDAAKWGRGYGEEVDFCLKAAHLGWRNVLLADTFVVHRGNVSFGNEKLQRVLDSAKKISQMYPFYDSTIQRYLAADPVRPVRRSLNISLIAEGIKKSKTLHVSHAFGGGTQTYVRTMAQLTADAGCYPVELYLDVVGNAELVFNMVRHPLSSIFDERHVEKYKASEHKLLLDDLHLLGIDRVQLNSVFGFSPALLEGLANQYDYDVTIHDYAWLCPRVTMTTPDAQVCKSGGVDASICTSCIKTFGHHPGLTPLLSSVKTDVTAYRDILKPVVASARTVFAGAECVGTTMQKAGFQGTYRCTAHPAEPSSVFHQRIAPCPPTDGVIKVAVIGAISDVKGFHQLTALAQYCWERKLNIEFQLYGYTPNDTRLAELGNVSLLGAFEESDLAELVSTHRPNMALFLNQWAETFSYTLSHAYRLGLWPIVTDIGAPAERVKQTMPVGSIIPLQPAPEAIVKVIFDAAQKMKAITSWPEITYPTTLDSYRG